MSGTSVEISESGISIEVIEDNCSFLTLQAKVNDLAAGILNISKKENQWWLIDVQVFDNTIKSFIKRILYSTPKHINYRGFGVGTALLNTVIAMARTQGADTIYGTMVGDIARLERWYPKFGFSIDAEDNIKLGLTGSDTKLDGQIYP